ncbi:MAG TPA: hypothetical protein VN665_01180 [Candidatus Paceibacterota bacterium]|nr:hypothetical protein [Candidatus Paceibacterota bacterium]
MVKKSGHLRLVSSESSQTKADLSVVAIASITEMQIVVPWYLRAFAAFISNPYSLTIQEFSEQYTNPLDIPTSTRQCNSFEELRDCLIVERRRLMHKGRLAVIDYTHKLGILTTEFNS